MIIYIDWVDLCWKSTLIRKIKDVFWWKYSNIQIFKTDPTRLPRSKDWEEVMEEKRLDIWNFYNEQLDRAIELLEDDSNTLIILDRFFLSEIVYWKVMRWYNFLDKEWVKELYDKVLEKITYINDNFWWFHFIMLTDTINWIMSRFDKVWDDYLSKQEQFEQIIKEFENNMNILKDLNFKTHIINVFESNWYWWDIIENIFYQWNYQYVRER